MDAPLDVLHDVSQRRWLQNKPDIRMHEHGREWIVDAAGEDVSSPFRLDVDFDEGLDQSTNWAEEPTDVDFDEHLDDTTAGDGPEAEEAAVAYR